LSAFDAARAADPMIRRWAMMNALLELHLAGSDDAALGGDLAYQFGMQAKSLRPLATLREGPVKLG
jgi:hypothetical protein